MRDTRRGRGYNRADDGSIELHVDFEGGMLNRMPPDATVAAALWIDGNGELAERTGLSRSTVSRLAQTLVACGMLERDRRRRAYRLAAPVLSLAHAMRTGSPALSVAGIAEYFTASFGPCWNGTLLQ